MSNNVNNKGKRYSFLQLIDEYNIQIPIIQRDYAQGRINAKEIRDLFLGKLKEYLNKDNNTPNDLDFVYGNVTDNNNFTILDGQQRLTTLFLLHWYLALKDGEIEEFRDIISYGEVGNKKSKFTYETRTSSKEFCDSLISADIQLDKLLDNSLSKTIQDSDWYFLSWGTDPTIQSMLVMLNAIHSEFNNTEDFYEKLANNENPSITFQFLELKEFKLTDDLYIKMNARGKALTSFENFKAKLEQYLSKVEYNNVEEYDFIFNNNIKKVNIKTYFSNKIDTVWSNLFWNLSNDKENYDNLIMNFFRAIITNNYASTKNESFNLIFLKRLMDKDTTEISFNEYFENGCITEKTIKDIILLLDLFSGENGNLITYLDEFHNYNELEMFQVVINHNFNGAGYVERIKFLAYCQYLIKFKKKDTINFAEGIQKWMRVVYNLTENTAPYNNENEYSKSILAINALIDKSNNILTHIRDLDKLIGFDEVQFKEEKIKAHLILRNDGWEELIFNIEKHGYFKGQIGFILFLSGIEYYKEKNNCDWDKLANKEYLSNFNNFSDIAKQIFTEGGLNDFKDFIFERALLSIEDYTITEGQNKSFLINFDRDISWKRFLKRDKDIELHSKIIKNIFNSIEVAKIEESLNKIINSYLEDKNIEVDWRSKFIKTPKLFEYLGAMRYVRKESTHGFILLKGKKTSSYHAELYTYSFYLSNLEGESFNLFSSREYYYAKGESVDDYPCTRLKIDYNNLEYCLDLLYKNTSVNTEEKFTLKFYQCQNQEINCQELESKLTNLEFSKVNDFFEINIDGIDVKNKIYEIDKSLKELNYE